MEKANGSGANWLGESVSVVSLTNGWAMPGKRKGREGLPLAA
ncbi:hypothetical protein R69919_05409 [Paraburkholderia gardini]|nr:hypothetical protein R69919_05409 [Paraburkholderia gardini]